VSNLIDQNYDLGWSSTYGQVTNQWVRVELASGQVYPVSQFRIFPRPIGPDPSNPDPAPVALQQFVLKVSEDGITYTPVYTGATSSERIIHGFAFPEGTTARYVELR